MWDYYKRFEQRLKERYERLYGGKDCKDKIEKNRKALLTKCAVILLILCIAVAADLFSGARDGKGLAIGKNGQITEVRRPAQENGALSFSTEVEIDGEKGLEKQEYYITIEPVGNENTQKEILPQKSEREQRADELRLLISSLNADTTQKTVKLPSRLESGETLTWRKAKDSNLPLYVILALASVLLLYKMRFYQIEREEKAAAASIIRGLPEFVNKIVLLLNAGVVLNTAFLNSIEDRKKTGQKPDYFYGQLERISRSMREANGSFHTELRQFAKRSGVKELMRIANIISDNISKGADLADKLKKENDLLWFSRKQQSEEKGRLAETKLTLPLVILLSVLIMITIAPALMGM